MSPEIPPEIKVFMMILGTD